MARKAAFHNLGCKVNAYEVEAMQEALEAAGYEIVPFAPGADVYVINTCTVTNIADRKSRQMLHRAKAMDRSALVVAVGCYVEVKGEEVRKDPAVDLVIGTHQKAHLADRIEAFLKEREQREKEQRGGQRTDDSSTPLISEEIAAGKDGSGTVYEPLQISRSFARTRAFLKVEDGCDNYCSYCIIPYARGHVRSRSPEETVREAQRLVESGTTEIVLTGIHICSYGRDLDANTDLLALIRAVHEIEGIRRLRLGSLEPSWLNAKVAEELRCLPKLCPHFHLSLQSGSDSVLARMKRHYTTSEFAERAAMLRESFDRPALTTDLITGFPGETEEEFEETRQFVERMDFFETHVFPYSRREGTRAAAMEGQCTEALKKERSRILLEMSDRHKEAYLSDYIGKPLEVLFEETIMKEGRSYASGHGTRYQPVLLDTEEDLHGEYRAVTPKEVCRGTLLA